ncbi:hypothetical protein HGRIS_010237 [Hohenbuehelia grisea]|uniref:STAS domain-containing protein n=1 Tax=Hohenbuehelia grisea TaxID=104357 RepID=A0ABR3J3P7_9AGAR
MTIIGKQWAKKVLQCPESETTRVITVRDWLQSFSIDPKNDIRNYFLSLFPIFGWIGRYNLGWLTNDLIAGFTVGMVVVPQGVSYAMIATLPPEYGLYSSFVGVFIYCFFATSKDVSIGPVAVMSLSVSHVIKDISESHPGVWGGPQIATTLSFICGFIVLGMGLLRLGWVVEFIPAPAVNGFMTSSAICIVSSQVSTVMGISGVDKRAPAYSVIVNTFKGLPRTSLDAAWGLTGLAALYGIRFLCDRLSKRYPRRARLFFFVSVLRNAVVLVILTIAAFLYARHRRNSEGKYPIKLIKEVPRGLQHVGQPVIDPDLLSALAPQLPFITTILLLEHIAIAKSFGRLNGYKVNPNQELIAIGATNTIGSCFGAFPATGSFSRTALKSKCGVRTPAAGIITAIVVIVALYGLTPAFYWIPRAGLSAVIIHAVADLVASPAQVYSYWRVSPLEFFVWVAAVLVTIFSSIQNGIYTSICASLLLLLIRISSARGSFLGKVTIQESSVIRGSAQTREVYLPLQQDTNAFDSHSVKASPPPPGIIIYRFEESYIYPNVSVFNSALVDYVKKNTRQGRDLSGVKPSERAWNDSGPSSESSQMVNEKLPLLHAVVLDFSAVSHIDTTAVQSLADMRNEMQRWTDRPVEFHFATILSPWIQRALVAGGFGAAAAASPGVPERGVAPVVPLSGIGDPTSPPSLMSPCDDVERGGIAKEPISPGASSSTMLPLTECGQLPTETVFFHIDLHAAVRAAETRLTRRLGGGYADVSERLF